MPSSRSWNVYQALKKTSPKAARDYIDMADVREGINRKAERTLLGLPEHDYGNHEEKR